MVLVSAQSPNECLPGDASPELDVVLRAALRTALDGVQRVCDELAEQLVEARRASLASADVVAERVSAIQAEADSAVQRARLESQVEISGLRDEVERLRRETVRPDTCDTHQQVEVLRHALAIARSDAEEAIRRLEEEKQKHARLIQAVRSMGLKVNVFPAVVTTADPVSNLDLAS